MKVFYKLYQRYSLQINVVLWFLLLRTVVVQSIMLQKFVCLIGIMTCMIYRDFTHFNRAYFIYFRLFGALVGTERVSTEATIMDIINRNPNSTLPCSKISVEPNLIDDYCKCSKGYKDLLDQALLLVITFMELCIYNNPISFGAIGKVRK